MALTPIARIHSPFPTKFGIPRQSNLVPGLSAFIVFEPEYRNPDALRGLEDFSHIWLIWGFSEAQREGWSPTVRPPRLGGNTRLGVFATRSPFRPNALGLSSVELTSIERHKEAGTVLEVRGADLMDGTPIYDIKPYVPFTDCHVQARGGFAAAAPTPVLSVEFLPHVWERITPEQAGILSQVLAQDPRPPYHQNPQRIYGMEFDSLEIRFRVQERVLTVVDILPLNRS